MHGGVFGSGADGQQHERERRGGAGDAVPLVRGGVRRGRLGNLQGVLPGGQRGRGGAPPRDRGAQIQSLLPHSPLSQS